MKVLKPSILALAIAIGIPASSNAQDGVYQLDCKSGGEMLAYFNFTNTYSRVDVFFEPAAKGSSEEEPGPGECAWVDRPLNSEESTKLIIQNVEGINIDILIAPGRYEVITPSTGASRALTAISRGNRSFSVMVRSDNEGRLVVGRELE